MGKQKARRLARESAAFRTCALRRTRASHRGFFYQQREKNTVQLFNEGCQARKAYGRTVKTAPPKPVPVKSHFGQVRVLRPAEAELPQTSSWISVNRDSTVWSLGKQLTLPLSRLPLRNSCCCPVWTVRGNCLTLS